MATTFKTLLNNDIASTRTLLHEAVPITGTIVSGTYSDSNIKNFSHGMFQSVYDYPYLSSSANHIFDITMGYSSNAGLSSSAATQNSKKINIYNQMAQVLMGHDEDGNIREFDRDGDYVKFEKEIPFKLSYKGNIADMSDDEEKQAYLEFLKVVNPWIKKTQGMKF